MFHWCSAIFALNFCHPSWPQTSSTSTVSEAPGMKAFFATMSRTPWQSNFQAKVWGDMCTKSFKWWENKIHFQNWPLRLCIPVQLHLWSIWTMHMLSGPGPPWRRKRRKNTCQGKCLQCGSKCALLICFFHSSGTPQHLFHGGFSIATLLQCYRRLMRPNASFHLHLERKFEWENKSQKRIMWLSPVCGAAASAECNGFT